MARELRRIFSIVALYTLAALATAARGQQQTTPHIGYVFPAGGRQGATVEAVIGGQRLDGALEAHISGTGVRVTLGELDKPLTPAQLNTLRDQIKELADRRLAALGAAPAAAASATATRPAATRPATPATRPATRPAWSAADEKTLLELRQKLQASNARRQGNAALNETIPVHFTIDSNAAPGPRELRLLTSAGLSDPLIFCVGQLPEYTATPYAPVTPGPNGLAAPAPVVPASAPAPGPAKPLALPVVVNGQIMPGGADRVRFTATKGTHLVVQTSARSLMPFLSDAVPGWFQAVVAIEDEQGREIAFGDHYHYDPDPVFRCEIPRDGTYVLKVRDSIYRGREDFVYRVTLGELPFITGIFPLGGHCGTTTSVQLLGWNLPVDKVTVDTTGRTSGKIPVAVTKGGIASNSLPFAIDTLPECLERMPNDTMPAAQPLTLPVTVNGRVEQAGVWHVFRFEGKANDKIVAEVTARRLGSPLDSIIKLTDAAGKVLAVNDDREDKAAGTLTQDADSYISTTLPANGPYFLHVTDAQQKGGPEYGFRLRLSAPRPDFELRVAPAELDVRAGTSVPLTVYAIRKDGYTGDIALALAKAPPGFALTGGGIPANQNEIKLTLRAPPAMLDEPAPLELEGRATIDGRSVSHTAVPAEDMMQAFAYHHLVPCREWLVSVPPQPIARAAIKILTPTPLKLSGTGTALIRASLPPAAQLGKVLIELSNPPDGVSVADTSTQAIANVGITLKYDTGKMKSGAKGNLIFNVFVERDPPAGSGPKAAKRRVPLGSMPAIPFEIEASSTQP